MYDTIISFFISFLKESTAPDQGTGRHFVPHDNQVVTFQDDDGQTQLVHKVDIFHHDDGGASGKILYGPSLNPSSLAVWNSSKDHTLSDQAASEFLDKFQTLKVYNIEAAANSFTLHS